jgi:hypothetical protein
LWFTGDRAVGPLRYIAEAWCCSRVVRQRLGGGDYNKRRPVIWVDTNEILELDGLSCDGKRGARAHREQPTRARPDFSRRAKSSKHASSRPECQVGELSCQAWRAWIHRLLSITWRGWELRELGSIPREGSAMRTASGGQLQLACTAVQLGQSCRLNLGQGLEQLARSVYYRARCSPG